MPFVVVLLPQLFQLFQNSPLNVSLAAADLRSFDPLAEAACACVRVLRAAAARFAVAGSPGCEPKTGNIAARQPAPRKNDASRSTLWRSERALAFTAVFLIQGAATML